MHIIRLREPWQAEWLDSALSETASRSVCYLRKFHKPTGLRDDQSVALAITPLPHCTHLELRAQLNDSSLDLQPAPSATYEIEISQRLAPFNQLQLTLASLATTEISASPPPLGELLEVQLRLGS